MYQSRITEVDFNKTADKAGGMYMLVIKASALHREIRRVHKHSNKFEHLHAGVTALKMIEAGDAK